MRQTAIRIKAEFAIPADTTDIDQFQAAVAKSHQLKAYAEEIGIVVSFEPKIGNIDADHDQDKPTNHPAPETDDNSNRATFPAEAMKGDQDKEQSGDEKGQPAD